MKSLHKKITDIRFKESTTNIYSLLQILYLLKLLKKTELSEAYDIINTNTEAILKKTIDQAMITIYSKSNFNSTVDYLFHMHNGSFKYRYHNHEQHRENEKLKR
jgi:hypothetical protein